MWYVQWTKKGDEEKSGNMVNDHVDYSFFTRCIVPYRGKREIHRGMSMFVEKLLFPTYVFIETDGISDFRQYLQCNPEKYYFANRKLLLPDL